MAEPTWTKPEDARPPQEEGVDESSVVATEIINLLSGHLRDKEWFEVRMIDEKNGVGYSYQIRQDEKRLTIQERITSNPHLVKWYTLEEKGGTWTYVDTLLIKHQESSLDKLASVCGRLKIAMEATSPKKIEE